MKITLLVLIVILNYSNSIAQNHYFEWVKPWGGAYGEAVYASTTDSKGYIYNTGWCGSNVDFAPGDSTYFLYSNNGFRRFFVQKLSPKGDLVWVKSTTTSSNGNQSFGHNIVVDNKGNVYITGNFEGTIDFDPSTAAFNLSSNGAYDGFILKLDINGDFLWAKSLGSTSYDIINQIQIDQAGDIMIGGSFSGTVDFDFDPVAIFAMKSNGGVATFVQKIDPQGNFLWAKSWGGLPRGTYLDQHNNIYTIGVYGASTVDFDPSDTATFNLPYTGFGSYDVYIHKLDAQGNFLWAKSWGGSGTQLLMGTAISKSGHLYTTGQYQGITDFAPDTTSFYSTTGNFDFFIQKLDSNGVFQWVKTWGGSGNDKGLAVCVDTVDNVYVAGTYEIDLNNPLLGNYGSKDAFLQKLDSKGNTTWLKSIGGTSIDGSSTLLLDQQNNIFWMGMFNGAVDFNPDGASHIISPQHGITDQFIVKLNPNFIPSSTEELESTVIEPKILSPNPTNGVVYLDLSKVQEVDIAVYTLSGQCIYQKSKINTPTHQFELSAPSGIYVLLLSSTQGQKYYKLIKA